MKSSTLFVEPLEPRVAPAILVNGGNLLGGAGNPSTGETSSGGNTVTLIKVLSGQALVFYDNGAITSISVGKHTKLDITGNVGDIVANLLPDGRLTDSDNNPANGEDGGVLMPYTIKGITTHPLGTSQNGDIGRIITGGAVHNVNVAGSITGIYAGDGIFRDGSTAVVSTGGVDYNTIVPGIQDAFTLTQANAKVKSDANIQNVVVHTANQLEVFAGNGLSSTTADGGAGGAIINVTVTQTLAAQGNKPALFLHAGDGGSGTAGGEGGAITNFDDVGSIAYVKVQTGDGGAASDGVGGAGGSLQNSTIVTSSPRYDLIMGHGGNGDTGGKGGTISALNFTNNVNGGQSLIATGDFNNDGIQDVLLINTVTGEGTLSLGTGSTTGAAFNVALQPATSASGAATTSPFIAAEGAVPTSVVPVDLNGDGLLDFVVSYASTDNLGVFINQGKGTFTDSSVALSASPTRIAAGNFSGSAAEDIAVLSGGNLASLNGNQNSQIFIAQGDGAGHLTVLSNPTTISGVGTALASAQIDGKGGTDLFVGLQSGQVTPLFANGTAFNIGANISEFDNISNGFSAPVASLDVLAPGTGGATLLAFTPNINVNNPAITDVTPQVNVTSVSATGSGNGTLIFTPDAGATTAHFVANSGGTIGVVTPASLDLYQDTAGAYTVTSSLVSDGVLSDFAGNVTTDGIYHLFAVGAATNRFFYTSGDLNSTTGLPAFNHFNIPYEERIISFVGGDGGDGVSHHGGVGGSVKKLTYTQTLGGGVLEAGGAYNTQITSGSGGTSTDSTGGRGGELYKVALSLNPGYRTDPTTTDPAGQDDTDLAVFTTGAGGAGATGGDGGLIANVTANVVFSDVQNAQVDFGAVALQLVAGNGGIGTVGVGGAGGSVTLTGPAAISGVTFYDFDSLTPEAPALLVQGGNGGSGVTAGGVGGTLTNVGAQNAITAGLVIARNELVSAKIASGNGGDASQGDAGAGGDITGLNVGVQSDVTGGSLLVSAGAGGTSTNGHGGAGGAVTKSTAAAVDGDVSSGYGVIVTGGHGGDGTLGGGAGGAIKKLTVNTPSATDVYAAVIAAGDGGDATVSGVGGLGGNVKAVGQSKDVNSAITAILAGSGGTTAGGAGGAGGSVKKIDTVGFIGLPATNTANLGVFDNTVASPVVDALFADGEVTQGVFAGRGADGSANGSVHDVTARQIAAIGAVVNEQGLFGVAAAVTKINADLIGYEVVRDNVFQSTVPGDSPSQAVPVDGFILAASVSGIATIDNARTAAFTFNG